MAFLLPRRFWPGSPRLAKQVTRGTGKKLDATDQGVADRLGQRRQRIVSVLTTTANDHDLGFRTSG
jgi:hypothetical protein